MPEKRRQRAKHYNIKTHGPDGMPIWWHRLSGKGFTRVCLVQLLHAAEGPTASRWLIQTIIEQCPILTEFCLRAQLQWLYNNDYVTRDWIGRETIYSLTQLGKDLLNGNP